jgi:hypothetical protein
MRSHFVSCTASPESYCTRRTEFLGVAHLHQIPFVLRYRLDIVIGNIDLCTIRIIAFLTPINTKQYEEAAHAKRPLTSIMINNALLSLT